MAEVTIKITGKQSSRVTVKYAPGECSNKEGYVGKASMTSRWGKPDWEQIAADDKAAKIAAGAIGVPVDDLRAGIAKMTETTRHMGPAVYRAACGLEIYNRTDGTQKPKKYPEVWMGHDGDDRHESSDMRTEKKPPEACLNCPKLKAMVRQYKIRDDYEGPGKDAFLFSQTAYVCTTFALVPGATPPPIEGGQVSG